MKSLILLLILLTSSSSFADVCMSGNVYEDSSCVDRTLEESKKNLNVTYRKIYAYTRYKNELEQSQKAWLSYRERQCNGYVAAEASQTQGAGSSLVVEDCLLRITDQRVDYLKTLLEK